MAFSTDRYDYRYDCCKGPLPGPGGRGGGRPERVLSAAARAVAEQRELRRLDLALHHDLRLDEDQQHLLVLRRRAVGEQALEEGDLREDRHALLDRNLAGERLAAQQQGAAVGDAHGRADFGDLNFRLLHDAGGNAGVVLYGVGRVVGRRGTLLEGEFRELEQRGELRPQGHGHVLAVGGYGGRNVEQHAALHRRDRGVEDRGARADLCVQVADVRPLRRDQHV